MRVCVCALHGLARCNTRANPCVRACVLRTQMRVPLLAASSPYNRISSAAAARKDASLDLSPATTPERRNEQTYIMSRP